MAEMFSDMTVCSNATRDGGSAAAAGAAGAKPAQPSIQQLERLLEERKRQLCAALGR